ncbi:MAG TPA: hydrogenase maturation nickel metallochaperone HypA [Methylocella sp.]|nr:hydrogenase maturation nickel metallochaperone HypA [Methylocella sp.]
MHELALAQSVVEAVARHANGSRVRRVKLEIGKLACVMPDALLFCFDAVTAGTPLEGAALEIVEIEGKARCRECGEIFVTQTHWAICRCGSQDCERLSGCELNIKEYELCKALLPEGGAP